MANAKDTRESNNNRRQPGKGSKKHALALKLAIFDQKSVNAGFDVPLYLGNPRRGIQ